MTSIGACVAKAVCDAGPLIHLAEIHQESLLSQFSTLVIPASVLSEAISFKAPPNLRFEVQTLSRTERLRATERLRSTLETGEVDAISICLTSPGAIFLSDDLKARMEAERLGIPVHGSLGIVVRAYRFGHLAFEDARLALLQLGTCRSLFISKAVVEAALEALDKRI